MLIGEVDRAERDKQAKSDDRVDGLKTPTEPRGQLGSKPDARHHHVGHGKRHPEGNNRHCGAHEFPFNLTIRITEIGPRSPKGTLRQEAKKKTAPPGGTPFLIVCCNYSMS